MRTRIRDSLSFSNVVALLALFVALGGSSYAALTIGSRDIANNAVRSTDLRNNDIRGKDIRRGTVESSDLKNQSLLAEDFKPGQLPAGAAGARGPQGIQGPPGPAGQAGTSVFASTIPSGTTIKGVFGGSSKANDNDGSAFTVGVVSFPVPAPADLSNAQISFPPSAQAADSHEDAACTGDSSAPTAPAGKVCLYIDGFAGATDSALAEPVFSGPASRFGFTFGVAGNASNPSQAGIDGTWAYTAP